MIKVLGVKEEAAKQMVWKLSKTRLPLLLLQLDADC